MMLLVFLATPEKARVCAVSTNRLPRVLGTIRLSNRLAFRDEEPCPMPLLALSLFVFGGFAVPLARLQGDRTVQQIRFSLRRHDYSDLVVDTSD